MSLSFVRLIRLLTLAGALLFTAVVLARPAPVAAEAGAPAQSPVPPRAPSVVTKAFRQGQVIGQGQNRAALVVRYDDGGYQVRCVAFQEEEIGGDELLERAGLDPVFGPSYEVCAIGGQGCPADNCFCECPFPNCKYWAYYHWENNRWLYSGTGADGYGVKNGALEGWSWGEGNFAQGTPPPTISFEEICPSTTATATPIATMPSRPTLSFTASPQNLPPGQCATLTWRTTGATTVLLNGISVAAEGMQQECPATTQTYTLIAANAVGQVDQQVTVQVIGAPSGQMTATGLPPATATSVAVLSSSPSATVTPAFAGQQPGGPTPAFITPAFGAPVVTQAPRSFPQTGQGAPQFPSPAPHTSPLTAASLEMFGGVPLAPMSEPVPQQQGSVGSPPTATRFVLARPPTETPRPRRILGETNQPTPTPMLVARSGGAPASGASAFQDRHLRSASPPEGGRRLAASREFTPALLPQYAAYLATLTILLALGWLVHRRRAGPRPSPVRQVAREAELVANRNERATQ